MIRALLFDFDGLILETEGPAYQSWLELYHAHGGHIPLSTWVNIIGTADHLDLFAELERQCGQKLDRQNLLNQRRQRELELVHQLAPLPGVVDYLQQARRLGLKTGIASSSSRAWVSGHLEWLGLLSFFDCLKTREDAAHTKPDPELYLELMRALQVSAAESLAFEDSLNGLLAARRAGLRCVAVPNDLTRSLSFDLADLQLGSLSEMPLPALLERFK